MHRARAEQVRRPWLLWHGDDLPRAGATRSERAREDIAVPLERRLAVLEQFLVQRLIAGQRREAAPADAVEAAMANRSAVHLPRRGPGGDRLGVRATPSLIEAEGAELVVREIALPRAATEAAR